MSLRHLLSGFDGHLLSAPATAALVPNGDEAMTRPGQASSPNDWRAWCLDGANDQGLPWWQPAGRRHPAVPWAHATAGADEATALIHLAMVLDGSLRLQACRSRADGLRLRAQVKWLDACWWRARQANDTWDAGQLIDGPDLAQRARRFTPRRATLILAVGVDPARLQDAAQAMAERASAFDYAVRLIRLGGATAMVGPSGSRLSSRNAPNSHERMPINKV